MGAMCGVVVHIENLECKKCTSVWEASQKYLVRRIQYGSTKPYSLGELFRCTINQLMQRAHDDEESKSDTFGKADAERRRCRDWLLPFMQNNQP